MRNLSNSHSRPGNREKKNKINNIFSANEKEDKNYHNLMVGKKKNQIIIPDETC